MAKLHELLAAEKTTASAWHQLFQETLKKLSNEHFFAGHSRRLKMLESTAANEVLEQQAAEEKDVPTNVYDTLEYALGIYARAEDLQLQKNATNRRATGTVMWKGQALFEDLPVDELLGLEARLTQIRQLVMAIPTLDATKHWEKADYAGKNLWVLKYPEESTKTEKMMTPVEMAPATDKHPAQVQAVTKDVVVGKFSMIKRSGAATAVQKAELIKRIDELMIEVKKARMRANEAEVEAVTIGAKLVDFLLEPLK